MDAFRNLLKGWFGKVLLALFILPFAFFGIEGLFMASGRSDVAIKVNGGEITQRQITQRVEMQRQSIMQRMAGMDPEMISDELIRPGVEKNLIQQELVAQAVEGRFFAPQDLVRKTVRDIPQLQDESGEFSEYQFRMLLQRAGYTGAGFLEEVASDLRRNQLRAGIANSAFVTPSEVEYLLKLDRQTRDLSVSAVKAEDFLDTIQLSEEEVEGYYQQNQSRYRTPEQVQLNYLVFSADTMSIDEPSDEDIEARYQIQAEAASNRERRRAEHILIEAEPTRSKEEARAKLQEVQEKLAAGADFSDLATEFSDDTASARLGGDLGFARRGIYDEAFEEALFALAENQVSDIVETEFGFHLIRLTGIEMADIEPLDDSKRAAIRSELKTERGRHALNEAMDHINRVAFESGDLQVLAEEYGIAVQQSGWLARQGSGEGVLGNERVLEAAFSEPVLQDRENSEVIDIDQDTLAVVRVADHKPAAVRALAEVRVQVTESLKRDRARQLAQEKAQAITKQLKAGEPALAVAEQHGLEWDIVDNVKRQNQDLDADLVRTAFAMPRPTEGAVSVTSVAKGNGDQAIVMLRGVKDMDAEIAQNELAQVNAMLSQRNGGEDFNAFVEMLEMNANIVRK